MCYNLSIKVMGRKRLLLLMLAATGFLFFAGFTEVFADNNVSSDIVVSVPVSCSIASTVNSAHTAQIDIGTYQSEIGETTFRVFCNDSGGFSVYAVGYSGDTYGNTTMKPSVLDPSKGIVTGTANSGNTSNWAMKLTAVAGDYEPTLATGYNAYHAVPANYTKVATFASSTDDTSGSSFKSTYATFVASNQPADTYVGKVKFTILHPSSYITPDVAGAMQNLASSSCTSTPTRVVDNRDGHVYIIKRLLDGNCWMMENLDLGRTDLTVDLTSANTNIVNTVTAATFNSWKTDSPTRTYDAGVFTPLDALNTVDGLDTDPVSGTAYGTLYNYYAVSAGTISGNSNSNDSLYNICPAGWRLPTGGSYSEYSSLVKNYTPVSLVRASIADGGAAFALAGAFSSSGLTGQGTLSRYWSATASGGGSSSGSSRWVLSVTRTAALAGVGISRQNGLPVRCILKEPKEITDLTYLQEFKKLLPDVKTSVYNSMQDDTTYSLLDSRDNHSYAVAKLKDGNVWMTENLDLGRTDIVDPLTYIDTNVQTSIAAATFNGWRKTAGSLNMDDGEFISNSDSTYGTLYNYYAASGGAISGSTNENNAAGDICPSGWRLPTGGGNGEYATLINDSSYNTPLKITSSVANGGAAFKTSGLFTDAGPKEHGSLSFGLGFYWTSTRYDDSNMHRFYLDSSGFANNYGDRSYGYAIRCIVK